MSPNDTSCCAKQSIAQFKGEVCCAPIANLRLCISFCCEYSLDLVGNVRILATHDAGCALDDGDPAPKAAVSLGHFKADIAVAENDQMGWRIIELERLDVRQRIGRFEAGNVWDRCVRPDVETHLLAAEHARGAVVGLDFEGFRRHEATGPQ